MNTEYFEHNEHSYLSNNYVLDEVMLKANKTINRPRNLND